MSTEDSQSQTRLSGGTLVAVGMIVMNVAAYGFTLVAARSLIPREFGALTALLGILLVGNVASLGLQATTARRLSVNSHNAAQIIAVTTRVTLFVALSVGTIVALSTFILSPLLKLDSYWPVVLCGLTLVPLTVMGAQSGVAQGTSRWSLLTAIYASNGVGRVIGGSIAVIISPTATAAMAGVAVGALLPVLVGSRLLTVKGDGATDLEIAGGGLRRRDLLRETVLGTHALLAYFVLSNLDALLARNLLGEHDSGLYASGLILAKAALFFPQFVSVVVFPDLARATGNRERMRAVALVGGFGVLAVGATAVLPLVALVLVGGEQYAEITSRLWLFALAGSILAVVHLLVFDALARHAHGVVVMLWIAVVAVIAGAYGFSVGITGLICTVAGVAAVLAVVVWFAPVVSKSRTGTGTGTAESA